MSSNSNVVRFHWLNVLAVQEVTEVIKIWENLFSQIPRVDKIICPKYVEDLIANVIWDIAFGNIDICDNIDAVTVGHQTNWSGAIVILQWLVGSLW